MRYIIFYIQPFIQRIKQQRSFKYQQNKHLIVTFIAFLSITYHTIHQF